ncbi:hypothetical protein NX774_05800 [Massilia agilis]|uniref:Oligosaccharide repeat unit polymerase n=1 Tax=Massilia agilis TaxID=1811226 RepID=A0ABT2D8G8_9BURK|nr:hypothetical protein [Massilia agilis]MCS0807437.1 hypothetical protein [Massilia agilis]
MKHALYLLALCALSALMAVMPWGSFYLSLILAMTYLCYRPNRVLHPNNMVFAFYGLYVILSSSLNLILELIDWEYVLPWGQLIFWDRLSKYTLFQAEFTFLVLYFAFHFFTMERQAKPGNDTPVLHMEVDQRILAILYGCTVALAFTFIEVTAGLSAWVEEYSSTYLTMREGHGLLNEITITFGNLTVFLLGVQTFNAKRKTPSVIAALLLMVPLSFIGGVKSRFIFLLIMFLSPYFMRMRFNLKYLVIFTVSFFTLLYLGTLVRTEGFYATAPFFLEMMIGYFNAFQLHDGVVTTRDPALFTTLLQVFTKPLQILGFIHDPDANFDISVMLTKEFFPDQWYREHATQQWPLDTELYLNYYGFYLSWIPLIAYGYMVSTLYRAAVVRRNLRLMPIFIMEFIRIFSTMRGALIPWDTFFYVAQYIVIYLNCRLALKRVDLSAGSSGIHP